MGRCNHIIEEYRKDTKQKNLKKSLFMEKETFVVESSSEEFAPIIYNKEELLKVISDCYTNGEALSMSNIQSLWLAIEEDYLYTRVPFQIYSRNSTKDIDYKIPQFNEELDLLLKLISFALINEFPFEIASFLCSEALEKNEYSLNFINHPMKYKCLRFPNRYLALRKENKRWIFKKKRKVTASKCIDKAYILVPPVRKKSREDFIQSIENQIIVRSTMYYSNEKKKLIKKKESPKKKKQFLLLSKIMKDDNIPFFPKKSFFQSWIVLRRIKFKTLVMKLQESGLAGSLSFSIINSFWYTVTLLFFWRCIFRYDFNTHNYNIFSMRRQVVFSVITRFFVLLSCSYTCIQVTKVLRVLIAIFVSPLADFFLNATRNKFSISERKAYMFISGTFIGISILVLSSIALLEFFSYFIKQGDFLGSLKYIF